MSAVVVVGVGNIGSHLLSHLARMPHIHKVTLIDPDTYEASNLAGQDITPADLGRPKSAVQAARLRRINPSLQVEALEDSMENIPLGRLRADLILACLDSQRSRQIVNQAAWRLGVRWIDSGVDPSGLLARVNAYHPAYDSPCLECAWDETDYASLEMAYPCMDGNAQAAATNAPSSLGALAASLQSIECEKLLSARTDCAVIGGQVLLDALHHKHYLTSFARNPRCRFDHEVWSIERLPLGPGMRSLRDVLHHGGTSTADNEEHWLQVEGKPFVSKLTCSGCGHTRFLLRLFSSLSARQKTCALCGEVMAAAGWDLVERLTSHLPAKTLSRPLPRFGILSGEIVSIGDSRGIRHFEITVTENDRQNSARAKSRKQEQLL